MELLVKIKSFPFYRKNGKENMPWKQDLIWLNLLWIEKKPTAFKFQNWKHKINYHPIQNMLGFLGTLFKPSFATTTNRNQEQMFKQKYKFCIQSKFKCLRFYALWWEWLYSESHIWRIRVRRLLNKDTHQSEIPCNSLH